MLGGLRRWADEWRPSAITLGAPTFPLIVLFGLNAVDELDRAAFGVLLPDIRDHFDLTNAGALQLVSLTTIAVLLIEIPLSFYCDRGNRVRIATIGATIWALFSFGTGGAVVVGSLGLLIVTRIGAGRGTGGRHAHALVAPVRLLRAGGPGEGVLRAPAGQLGRADPRSAARGCHRGDARPGLALLPLRHPDPGVRRHVAAPARAGARLPRAEGGRPRRGGRAGRRRARGRVGDHEGALPGAHDPADLVRGPLPRRRALRGRLAPLPRVRGGVQRRQRRPRAHRRRRRTPPGDRRLRGHPSHRQDRHERPRLPLAVRRHRRGARRVRARRPGLLPVPLDGRR